MGAPPRRSARWCAARLWRVAALALAVPGARGQIYTFEEAPVPETKSLHTMYAFYVYSHQDAPEKSLGHEPFVKFHGLFLKGVKEPMPPPTYEGIQLSILPYANFWNLIDKNKFCATAQDAKDGLALAADQLLVRKPVGSTYADVNVYAHTVKLATPDRPLGDKDVQIVVRETGVYILVFSNCGDVQDATVQGSVLVKNAYGFLPGNEYHKLPFYGWLSLFYSFAGLIWMSLSLRYWRELFHIQYCIAVVVFLGLVEAFLWWIFFNDWNHTGIRGRFLFIMAILSSVLKSIFSYMLVLVASLGWGVTRPYLDQRTIMKVQGMAFLYIVLDFIRESVLSFRHSHSLTLTFVLLCLLPVALLNGAIFYWIFTALSSLMETLRDRRQMEKLVLFERLWRILVFALAVASCTLLFQIFDLSRSISIRWHYQWFFADGMSHILFMLVLAAMMYLWAPHTNSQRYAYDKVADDEDEDGAKATEWADEAGDDADDESFWATTHKKPREGVTTTSAAAEKIGAGSEAD